MLFTNAALRPGQTVLVQGAGGGVATAAIALARQAGFRVWATSRDEDKRAKALALGAHDVFESNARLPERVDAVIETVGKATWSHSMKALRPGGTLVVSGATTGGDPSADLNRLFFLQLRVIGSTMGSRDELRDLLQLCAATGLRPIVDDVRPLSDARASFARMAEGNVFGKLVLTT
jgi:NADPH:quinone reductase-like Zn-dependent oxidoreductase